MMKMCLFHISSKNRKIIVLVFLALLLLLLLILLRCKSYVCAEGRGALSLIFRILSLSLSLVYRRLAFLITREKKIRRLILSSSLCETNSRARAKRNRSVGYAVPRRHVPRRHSHHEFVPVRTSEDEIFDQSVASERLFAKRRDMLGRSEGPVDAGADDKDGAVVGASAVGGGGARRSAGRGGCKDVRFKSRAI